LALYHYYNYDYDYDYDYDCYYCHYRPPFYICDAFYGLDWNEKEWKSHGEKTNNTSHLEDSHHTKAYLPAYAASEHHARFLTPDFCFPFFFFPSLFGMQTVCPPETWGWLIWARWDSDGARKWEWEWEWEWAGTGHGYGWIL